MYSCEKRIRSRGTREHTSVGTESTRARDRGSARGEGGGVREAERGGNLFHNYVTRTRLDSHRERHRL